MKKPKLYISRIRFDPAKIAEALRVRPDDVQRAFTDGRGAWPFSEVWGTRLYEFIAHSNTNNPVSDGVVALQQLGDFRISVKALGRKNAKFQQSRDVGSGRSATRDGLLGALEACDRVIVVDLTLFPAVSFLPLETTRLVTAVHHKRLGTSGWSKAQAYRWLDDVYDWSILDLDI